MLLEFGQSFPAFSFRIVLQHFWFPFAAACACVTNPILPPAMLMHYPSEREKHTAINATPPLRPAIM